MSAPRVVVCGAGVVGCAVAHHLALRGVAATVVDRVGPGAASSGKGSGFLALDWNDGTPAEALARAGFALHRELADDLGAERVGYRPLEVLMVAAGDEGDLERYRGLPDPAWLDGNAVAHRRIGDVATAAQIDPLRLTTALAEEAQARGARVVQGVVEGLVAEGADGAVSGVVVDGAMVPADHVVLALGPWTPRAQRWLALPQVLATRMASLHLGADLPAQAVFSEFHGADRRRVEFRIYPRPGGRVYVTGLNELDPLPEDPAAIAPAAATVAELRRIAGVHSSALADAPELTRTACYRALTVDGLPLIGPVPGSPGVILATAHASWGLLYGPVTGRMVAEMILDGRSVSLDAAPFRVDRLPAGRIMA